MNCPVYLPLPIFLSVPTYAYVTFKKCANYQFVFTYAAWWLQVGRLQGKTDLVKIVRVTFDPLSVDWLAILRIECLSLDKSTFYIQ